MDLLQIILLVVALAAAAAIGIEAIRKPIIARMAARNALRRPRQTLTVIAGLMIGTAIISSALVAGDSARGAIRGYVYQSLGEVDESVAVPSYPYFPQAAFDAIAADPEVQANFDAVAPHVIWQGAVDLERTGTFEPEVGLIGFDPQRDAGFGEFHLTEGRTTDARSIQSGQGIATKRVADAIGLEVGDTVTISFQKPTDPILPRIFWTNGTANATAIGQAPPAPPPPVPLPGPIAVPQPSMHVVGVERNATFIAAGLFILPSGPPFGQAPTTGLHAVLRGPDGIVQEGGIPVGGNASRPFVITINATAGTTIAAGNWTLTVSTTAGQVRYVGAVVVGYPVYDIALLRERGKALQQQTDRFRDLLPGLDPFSDRETTTLRIVGITDGGRGDMFDFGNAIFLPMADAQRLFGREGQVNLVKFSNPGDRIEGEAGTDRAMEVLNATLAGLREKFPDVPAVHSLEANALKRDFLAAADAKGVTLTGLLLFAGALSIITGMLLILNIFTMLAEERRGELGMSRAIGMGRGDLVRLFLFEGSLYAIVAAFIGALLGLVLAFGMIAVMNSIISRLSTDLSFPAIEYTPSVGAVVLAFAGGSILTLATIFIASRRQASLNVVRAIRRIEEPEGTGSHGLAVGLGLPLALLGITATVLGMFRNPFIDWLIPDYRLSLRVFGPLVAAIGSFVLLRPFVKRRVLAPVVAGALAVYYAMQYFTSGRYENQVEGNIVGPIRGVMLTLCVVLLVVHWESATRSVGRMLARLKPFRAVALPAVSYPMHKKFRTGMTLAMFSVVLLSIAFFSIFGALFQVDPGRHTGGFDVEARATLSVPDLADYDQGLIPPGTIETMVQLPEFRTEDRDFITVGYERVGTFKDYRHVVYGYDASFVKAQRFRLLERVPQYDTDEDAYNAVLARDDLVIVSYVYSTNEEGQALQNKAGERLQINLGSTVAEYTIIGIQEQYHYPGIYLPRSTVESLFPGSANIYLFQLAPGVSPTETARLLERNYREIGLDAKDSLAEVLEEQASFRQLLGAMKLFLGLGLLVGVLSLGIITSRNVLERRQEIGMLRALGYTKGKVRLTFFIEVTFTVLLGAAVGIACAILVTYGLWFAIIRELNYPYVIPWAEIGVLIGISYIVALLAAAAPIGRSAKVAPAEALRYLE